MSTAARSDRGVQGLTTANEDIIEATAGLIHTFFRDPKIGGVQFLSAILTLPAYTVLGPDRHATAERVGPHDLFDGAIFSAMNIRSRPLCDPR